MTEEDISFDKRQILGNNQEQKKSSRDYWKTQNEKRLNVGISRTLIGQLRRIREYTRFTNDDQTLEYLLDLEKDLREHNLIKEVKVCEKCGAPIDVKLDSYKGITHQHVDSKSNCFGCITTKHRVNTKIEMLPGTIETKMKPIEQAKPMELIDPRTVKKKRKTAKEIENMTDEEFDAHNIQEMLESGLVD